MSSPFHVEHIGSFLRPPALAEAALRHQSGALDDAGLARAQDDAIRAIVAFQESLGLPSITDGEFRRREWSAGFVDAVDGFDLREGTFGFRDATRVFGLAASPYARAPLRRRRRIVADDFRFLRSVTKRGVPKATLPAPTVMHYFLAPHAWDPRVYRDREAYFHDLTEIYRTEIADLAKEGCTYLQLDDTALPCNCDAHARNDVTKRGESPDELTDRYARLINEALSRRPPGMKVALHLCRGNLKGAWMAEGGYEPIAETLFNRTSVDVFCLEYDTLRAGSFAPLRHVPAGKVVVLGLVSTKTPVLESKDELKRRIDAAAKYVPLERLALSPQCGFASDAGEGQPVGPDDTRRKLDLVMEVAREVWGRIA